MAFESVDVSLLKNEISVFKNNIDYADLSEVLSKLGSENWSASSKNNLKQAIDTLINLKYKNLSDTIDRMNTLASYVEEYKNLEVTNQSLQANYDYYSNNLYNTVATTNDDGEIEHERVLNQSNWNRRESTRV